MFPEYLIIIILFLVLLGLVFSLIRSSRSAGRSGEPLEAGDGPEADNRPCPLCEMKLPRGERVHSVIYSRGEDRLMNIHGCPWCYPGHPAGFRRPDPPRERRCPSCGTRLKEDGFAVARVFERPGRKMHVHVLGCPVCRHQR